MIDIAAKKMNGETKQVSIDKEPDECPICKKGLQPIRIHCFVREKRKFVEIVYQCPRHECQRLFIAYYDDKYDTDKYWLAFLQPITYTKRDFDQIIGEVSPGFVEIYNQAFGAEQRKLNQICGMGYRKALEFLVKDYLIQTKSDIEQDVRSLPLGALIQKHVDDENIKACSKRAVWLGNDETHYERKWTNKDVTDLKDIIDLVVYWIVSNIKTKRLLADMPE